MVCQACGSENLAGRKFCAQCGAALAVACAACGAPNEPGARFCGECGTALEAAAPPAPAPTPPAAERRLVSVLFADLVGFTTLSEARDSEDVRELLSAYFDEARRIVERYGGIVEKFIGDAVMAVWGTPVAQEDDAERAVRAALELTTAVPALHDGLHARAGVLTGEAAVTVGAAGEGMVAGDLVNAASRVQGLAAPGTVLVGEATRRATSAAVAYEDAGTHELKGKAGPVELARALRVIAARRGEGRAHGLEAPFVGRDAELRLVKDLFHATAEERRTRLVSVVGVAGIGKSRLAWEFEKYLDGLVDTVLWHRGRCLAYGEGVAYWALAEMVRMRARIREEEAPGQALAKLRAILVEYVLDDDERSWLEPRVAQLLGLAERAGEERGDLFAAWRLFFERLADQNPTVLVFEDLQWADSALLDFVQYLLDWSRSYPLFVVTLARPELTDRHPGWTAGKRDFTSLSLEPLAPAAMEALLAGLVPGLPGELRVRIRDRAEGVPLYAVETVRMLLDRGLLERSGDEYRPTGPIDALEVPETLHALIAARLDGLPADERRVLDDASVLGKTFTKRALSALSGLPEEDVDPLLAGLVRKEVLSLQVDPRSPERGQYGFLQALVQKVAHDTLSKREQKSRHLAAARFFETAWGADEDEIVEVVASHYLDALRADPEADDAPAIKAKARERLRGAGERAASLAAAAEAQRYFEQSAALADDPLDEAALLEQAGVAAHAAGHAGGAIGRFERAIELLDAGGRRHASARVSSRLGLVLWQEGRTTDAAERMEESFAVLASEEPNEDVAAFAAELARLHYFLSDRERAAERIELALEVAEAVFAPAVLSEALNTKHLLLDAAGRPEEALALVRHALQVALEHDAYPQALRAYFNLSYNMAIRDRLREAVEADREGLALARRLGDRSWEIPFLQHVAAGLFYLGDWDEAVAICDELAGQEDRWARATRLLFPGPWLDVERGDLVAARERIESWDVAADDVQERSGYDAGWAQLLLAEGAPAEALVRAEAAFASRENQGMHVFVRLGFALAVEAALALGRDDRAEELLAQVRSMPPGGTPPFIRAQAARIEARLAARRGDEGAAAASFAAAASILAEIGLPLWLAIVQLEHAEWLLERDRGDEAGSLLAEARSVFERLGATRRLRSLDALAAPVAG